MPRWTQSEYEDWIRRNIREVPVAEINHSGKITFVEPASIHEPLAAAQTSKEGPGRILVRVTSVRKRLLDEDNLSEKGCVDCCRYAGIIPSDHPEKTKIEVSQRRCQEGEQEHIIVEIWKP